MMTIILYLLIALNNITMKVTGLTCSMCSLSVKKSIEKVYFVSKVDANVEEVTYNIEFKKNYYIDFFAIENAVLDAGFNVDKESVVVDVKNTNEFWQNSNYIIWKNKE